jgi:flagellar basal body-associated protein FliL
MAHDVFISYSNEDKSVADAVCSGLETAGIRCWIAPRDILPSEEFDDAIIRAIIDAKLVVVIFSSSIFDSKWAKGEIQTAFDKGKPIIPFRIELVEPQGGLELLLGRKHWLDALTPPLELHIEKLVQSVRAIFAASGTSRPEINRPFSQSDRHSPRQEKRIHSHRLKSIVISLIALFVLLGLLAGAGGIWWFFRNQNETRIKTDLVTQIEADVSDIMTGVQFVEVGASNYSQEEYDQDFREWESRRAVIKSQIQTDFPQTQLAAEWGAYSDIVTEVYALSGTYMPDYRSERLNRIQAYLVTNNLDKNIDWSVLAKIEYRNAEYEKQQQYLQAWFALRDRVLERKDEIITEILHSGIGH